MVGKEEKSEEEKNANSTHKKRNRDTQEWRQTE